MRACLIAFAVCLLTSAVGRTQEGGWTDLFGTDLDAFRPVKTRDWHRAADVGLDPANPRKLLPKGTDGPVWVNGPKGRAENLFTKEKFGDVEVHLEFVMSAKSN